MNIRSRLTLIFAIMVASILLLFSVTIYLNFSQYRGQEFRQRLSDRAQAVIRVIDDVQGDTVALKRELNLLDNGGLYQSGVVLFPDSVANGIAQGAPIPPLNTAQIEQVRNGKRVTLAVEKIELLAILYTNSGGHKIVVAVAAMDRYGYSKLQRLRDMLIFGWLISLFLVIMAGYLFAGDVLKPVSEIINQVNAISATNMYARLRTGPQSDELTKLAATFNDMLNRLEEAFTAQKNFVSYASHELRTPLTAMIGHIEVSLMQNRSTTDYRELLESLLEEARSMKQLVNGLLEFAYASADASTLTFQPVRVDELLFQVQESLQKTQPNYAVSIEYDNIPEDDNDLIVSGVEPLLRTAFTNLIENGCRYSPGNRLTVCVFTDKDIQIRFKDNGPGIPAEDLPFLFEPFRRPSNQLVQQSVPLGLGLALAKRIVTLHRGQIQVNTNLREGNEFVVSLPNSSSTARTNADELTA